jgi:hypothetical protein
VIPNFAFNSAIVTATTVNGNFVPAVKAEEGIDLSSTQFLITTVFW